MTEKNQLLENLLAKTDKSKEEIEKLISEKVEELSGLVSEEGAIYIIANELGVRLENPNTASQNSAQADLKKIKDITEPKTPVSLDCKVIKKYDKVNFSSQNGSEGSVQSLFVGDDSGVSRLTFWNDKTELLENIQEKDILRITNAYTRENNSNPERIDIHFGQYSELEVNPEGITITLPEITPQEIDFKEKKISELEEGDKNIKLHGIVTDFDIPRFYLACPKTFKKVFQDEGKYISPTEGEVEPIKVPIINIVIDDGTGNLGAVGFRDRAEELTKLSSENIIKLTENIDKYKEFSRKVVGAKIEIGGNISQNSYTGELQILVNQVLNLNVKNVDELTNELVDEVVSNNSNSKAEKTKENDFDLDIEEIDIDDDLL